MKCTVGKHIEIAPLGERDASHSIYTEWFLPRHQPKMHSVYEIKFRVGTNFLFWGRKWVLQSSFCPPPMMPGSRKLSS